MSYKGMSPLFARSVADRFWEKVADRPEDDCWVWGGHFDGKGYGQLRIGSRTNGTRRGARAHRLSWEVNCGPVPDGQQVLHKCDNRKCVNPKHLFLGTHLDNMVDMARKGRNIQKLSVEQVIEIREQKGLRGREVAKMFGVSEGMVSMIRSGKCRQHAHQFLPACYKEP